ncbi:MAG: hypothetical protein J0G37_16245 [Afipia sp.]|nr:hypothetical protein [Afipia sp.]
MPEATDQVIGDLFGGGGDNEEAETASVGWHPIRNSAVRDIRVASNPAPAGFGRQRRVMDR